MTKRAVWMGAIFSVGIANCTAVEDEDEALQEFEDMQARDGLPPGCPSDVLYISDLGETNDLTDDFIARFDANTGESLGKLEPDNVLNGPIGILVDKNKHILLANQNFPADPNVRISGSLLLLKPTGNAPPELLVAPTTEQGPPNPPWIPRGMILDEHDVLYVADMGDARNAANNGRITLWHSEEGTYLGDLDFTGFGGWKSARGIVGGPDGYIYVSNSNLPNPLGGSVLRFHPETGKFVNVVYECIVPLDEEPECDFHRPEGVVFDRDGRLLVTNYRADESDFDRIAVLEIADGEGTLDDTIKLDDPGGFRAFATAILFGLDDTLYAPITSPDPDECSVRRYKRIDGNWQELACFVGPGTSVIQPFYLSFGQTNPWTLAYEPKKQCD